MIQHGKSEFLKDMRRNTKRALRKLKSKGKWVGAVPTGYTTEGEKYDRRLVLGEDDEIALVRRIFDLRAKAGSASPGLLIS